MKPRLSYTIWFSQRTGSTLLCNALESTGIAGNPQEWLNIANPADLLEHYHQASYEDLQHHLWAVGSTPNGVFGLKFGPYEPHFSALLQEFQKFPACPQAHQPRPAIWEHAFPNSRHIFMTRRSKVRLAVSWWKAIQTQQWHAQAGDPPSDADLNDAYSFEAINHLFIEASMREAGMQAFFSEGSIMPMTVVYEDFILDHEAIVRRILDYLGLESASVTIAPPQYTRLADDMSERWVQRFREERQQGWANRGW